MVSVGLSATPERTEVDQLQPPVRAVRADPRGRQERHDARDDRGVEHSDKTITSLQGSTAEQLVPEDVPEREVELVPRSERGVPGGLNRPRNGIVVENYLLAQFNKSNNNALKEVAVPEAAARRVRLLRSPEGQPLARAVSQQVHLHDAEERCAGARPTRRPSARHCRRCRPASDSTDRRGRRRCRRPRRSLSSTEPTAGERRLLVRRPRRRRRPGRPRGGGRGGRLPASRSRSSTSGPRSAVRSSSSPGPGFRVTDPTALGKDFRPRPRADRGGRAERRDGAAPHRRRLDPRHVARPRRGRAGVDARSSARHADPRARRSRPAGRLPGLDAPRRDHRRRRTDPRQDAARAAGQAGRLRRQRPARAGLPGAARGLRRRRHGRARGRARARARARSSACSAPREGTPTSFATRSRYRSASCAPASRCATAGSSSRAEGDGRVEQVVHAAADAAWRPVAGTEETVAADTLCLGYGFFPSTELLRLAGCAFAYDEDLGGPTVVRDEWLRTTVAGDLGGRRRHRRRRAPTSRSTKDGSQRSARCSTSARSRRTPRRASGARSCAGFGSARLPAGAASASRGRAGDLRARHAGDVGLPLRGAHRAPDRGGLATTADLNVVKILTRAGWGCARAATASASRGDDRAPARLALADLPVSTPRAPVRPVPIAAVADADR